MRAWVCVCVWRAHSRATRRDLQRRTSFRYSSFRDGSGFPSPRTTWRERRRWHCLERSISGQGKLLRCNEISKHASCVAQSGDMAGSTSRCANSSAQHFQVNRSSFAIPYGIAELIGLCTMVGIYKFVVQCVEPIVLQASTYSAVVAGSFTDVSKVAIGTSGVYGLFYELQDGRTGICIGESGDIRNRLASHKRALQDPTSRVRHYRIAHGYRSLRPIVIAYMPGNQIKRLFGNMISASFETLSLLAPLPPDGLCTVGRLLIETVMMLH